MTSEIEPPRSARPFYPPDLEKIVFGALERNRGARYADAKSLADDLEKFLYKRGEPAGTEQVAEYMRSHFDDRYAVRQALLGADDAPGGGVLTMQDLQSETSLGSDIAAGVEKSGRRRKAPISEPAPTGDPVDELLASLEETDRPDLAPEPDGVVDIAVVLDAEDPEPTTRSEPKSSEPPTTPGVRLSRSKKGQVVPAEAEEKEKGPSPSRPRLVLPSVDAGGDPPPPISADDGGGRGKVIVLVLLALAVAAAAVYFLAIEGL